MEDHNVNSFVKRSKTLSSNGKERERETVIDDIFSSQLFSNFPHIWKLHNFSDSLWERESELRVRKGSPKWVGKMFECVSAREKEQHGKSQLCEQRTSRNFSPALASQLTRPKSWAQIFVKRKFLQSEKRITKTT